MEGYSFSAVAQGFLHKKDGLDCQDYAGSEGISQLDACVFAISDGHGDPSCVRSALGSRFAVEVALRLLTEFAHEWKDNNALLLDPQKGDSPMRDLCASLVRKWKERAEAHLASMPLAEEQWASLGDRGRQIARERPSHLYGATLVAGLVTPRVLLLIQQGDGCCVVLDRNGRFYSPIPEDERCIGNVTSSLCDPDSAQRMRYRVIDLQASPAAACFVGSDGIDKSLYGTAGLYDFCGKLALDTLGNLSPQDMEESLRLLLGELSEFGCGDDASLAGFARIPIIAQLAPTLVNNRMRFVVASELEQERSRLNSMKRMHDRYVALVPQSNEEQQRRDVFLAEYEGVRQRIQDLEAQLKEGPFEEHASSVEPIDDAKTLFVNRSLSEAPLPKQELVDETLQTNRLEPIAPIRRKPPERTHLPVIVVICLVVASLCVGFGVLLGKWFASSAQVGSNTVAEVGTVQSSEEPTALPEESDGPQNEAAQNEAAQNEVSQTQDIELQDAVNGFVDALVLSNDESYAREMELGLSDDRNQLRNFAFGNLRAEVSKVEAIDDTALVLVNLTCGDLSTVLEAERDRNAQNPTGITLDSLVSQLTQSQYQKQLSVTLCMQQTTEGWVVCYPSSEYVASKLLNESGYLGCLQSVAGQVDPGVMEETSMMRGDDE